MQKFVVAALVGVTFLASMPAQAVTALYQTNFIADFSGVIDSSGTPAPVQTVTGAYKVSYNNDNGALTVSGFVLKIGDQIFGLADVIATATPSSSFYYPYVLLSGTPGGTDMGGGTLDFSIGIDGPNKRLMDVGYTFPGTTGIYVSRSFTLSPYNPAALPVSVIPEPASWTLMVLGFGFVGAALRRRQRARVTFT
jgi:hypothetical protein